MSTNFSIDVKLLKGGINLLHALNHPFRQVIIKVVHKHERINVTDLYRELRSRQSNVSAHLRLLREGGFVSNESVGRNIYYFLNYNRLKLIEGLLKQMAV